MTARRAAPPAAETDGDHETLTVAGSETVTTPAALRTETNTATLEDVDEPCRSALLAFLAAAPP